MINSIQRFDGVSTEMLRHIYACICDYHGVDTFPWKTTDGGVVMTPIGGGSIVAGDEFKREPLLEALNAFNTIIQVDSMQRYLGVVPGSDAYKALSKVWEAVPPREPPDWDKVDEMQGHIKGKGRQTRSLLLDSDEADAKRDSIDSGHTKHKGRRGGTRPATDRNKADTGHGSWPFINLGDKRVAVAAEHTAEAARRAAKACEVLAEQVRVLVEGVISRLPVASVTSNCDPGSLKAIEDAGEKDGGPDKSV